MSDRVIEINTAATKQGLEGHETRIVDLESQILAMRNEVQTLIGMMQKLQIANTLALQELRGTGPTSGSDG